LKWTGVLPKKGSFIFIIYNPSHLWIRLRLRPPLPKGPAKDGIAYVKFKPKLVEAIAFADKYNKDNPRKNANLSVKVFAKELGPTGKRKFLAAKYLGNPYLLDVWVARTRLKFLCGT
jgi:hypothetical protein